MVQQVISVVVINPEGQVFLMRRCAKRDIGRWEYPAGKVDPGELILDAAKRELKEEAGLSLDLTAGHLIDKEDVIGRDGNPMQVYTFRVYLNKGWEAARFKEGHTFDMAGWFTPDKALALALTEPARARIATL